MIKHVWSVLCTDVISDRERNTVSYINCVEHLKAPQFPATLFPLYLAIMWEAEPTEAESQGPERLRMKVTHVDPQGSKKKLFESPEVPVEWPKLRTNVRLVDVQVTQPGIHRLHVHQKNGGRWKKVADIPFSVRLEEKVEGTPVGET